MKSRFQKGAAVLTVVMIFLALSVLIVGASYRIAGGEAERTRISTQSGQSYFVAESAAEDVAYRLKKGYDVSSSEDISIGSSTIPIGFTTSGAFRVVGATSTLFGLTRGVGLSLFKGTGIDFFYGIHAGVSGMTLSSSATVNGNVFSGGDITGFSSSRIIGNASAVGTISSSNPVVTGTKTTGVAPVAFPEFDDVYWKNQANINNDPYIGNLSYNGSGSYVLGPKKIQGNLTLNSSTKLTLTGPLHVTGNLALNSSSQIFLNSDFGSQGTVIVVDGTIDINSSAAVHATNSNPKGYILLVSLATGAAIDINSSGAADALVLAKNGSVQLNSSARATSVTGKGIILNSSATITYDLGLEDASFSAGPSGGWEIEGWGESQ